MDAIAQAQAINSCQQNMTPELARSNNSPFFDTFRETGNISDYQNGVKLFCREQSRNPIGTITQPDITNYSKDTELNQRRLEAKRQTLQAEQEEKVIAKKNETVDQIKQTLATSLTTTALGSLLPFKPTPTNLLLLSQFMVALKQLEKLRQKKTKASLEKGKETFSYPMKPMTPELPNTPQVPSIPDIPNLPTLV